MVALQRIYFFFFNTYLKNDKKTICREQVGEGEEAVIYQENTHTLHIFIHLSGNGYLGCFHVLAIVKSAAKNIGVHISFQRFSLDIWPRVGLQDHMVTLIFFNFKGFSIFFSIMAVPIYILNNSVEGFLLLHTLSSICYLQTF